MKKTLSFLVAIISTTLLAIPLQASETEHFREAVEHAIKPIVSEDVPAAISATEALVKQGAELVASAAGQLHGHEQKLAQLTADNAEKMLTMSSEELEEGWIQGEFLKTQGIDVEEFDHFSKVMAYFDMVVHPAVAHSLLKEYQSSKERYLLTQAREELSELLEHEVEEEEHGEEEDKH